MKIDTKEEMLKRKTKQSSVKKIKVTNNHLVWKVSQPWESIKYDNILSYERFMFV